jgi:ribosome-binding factor A
VSDLLREEIAEIIAFRLKDPRIGFVTVTGVDVTEDIRMAFVYVSVLNDEEKKMTIDILNSAKSFVRNELSKRLRLKTIPTIEFRLDVSIEYGDRIERLLNEIKKKDESS